MGSIFVEAKLQVSINQSLASCNYLIKNENLWPKGLDMRDKSSVTASDILMCIHMYTKPDA
jgi:hypothetical protein